MHKPALILAAIGLTLSSGAAVAAPLTALTTSNSLFSYDTSNVGAGPSAAVPITGLVGGETIIGIDYRPSTAELYGVSDGSRLYKVNPATGAASLVASLSTALNLSGTNPAIAFDFNPVPDRIRIIANRSGQNLRVNPVDGSVTVDTTIPAYAVGDAFAGSLPQISAAAYLPAGGGVTTLYGFDDTTDRIVRIGGVDGTPSPNTGVATTVAGLGGINGSHVNGMDVAANGTAYLSLDLGGGIYRLFQLDLTVTNPNTNSATLLGTFNTGATAPAGIADIALVPEPGAASALAATGLVAICRRRRRLSDVED